MGFLFLLGLIGFLVLLIAASDGNQEASTAVQGIGGAVLAVFVLAALCAVLVASAGVDVFALAGGAR